ncbi:YceI family protein [Paenibacillus glufosinatiresistens]|uniref:YceI family protein n=1 Tax=Paenibacillus glufosinatiresistens TaxID=3070657 RepID=UPI00286DA026|nr:YceI family protein [Paenibacillus sp. YX.27]
MNRSKWTIDLAHSMIEFSVRHMMVSRVKGRFERFEADIEANPEDMTTADINVTIDAASFTTDHPKRDEDVRGALFLATDQYPLIQFASTEIVRSKQGEYILNGELTLRGITRQVSLQVEYGGLVKDHRGYERAGFAAETVINRKDYGLTYNIALEAGGIVVGEEVKISIALELIKKD